MDNAFSPYDRYLQLKEKFDYQYRGYNLKQLIPGYLNFVFDGYFPSARSVAKAFHQSRMFLDMRKALAAQSPTVITYLIKRADYRNLALAARSYYADSEVIDLPELPTLKKHFFTIPYFCRLLKALFIVFTRRTGLPLLAKLYLTAVLVRIFNQIGLLESVKFGGAIRRYVCFNSAYREESVLTAYFNRKSVETITLQHGIFCKFKLLIPFDYINFDNFVAQKMLCWGQSTIDFLTANGIDADRLILMGNLKYKGLKIDRVNQTFKKCLVLLGRALYLKTNDKLLEALSAYNTRYGGGIVFYIKKHPFLLDEDHKRYASAANNIIFVGREHSTEEILKSEMVDFSIAVNTTAYYESLALGKPCLRWTEAENEDFYGMDDKFASPEELDAKITALKAMDTAAIKREMQDVIRYIFNAEG
ncbi:MAG: hypothetical protein LBR34_11950 [Prevotella sp.]|jgi:hypothetical protein|nr:hypothetical protein [Prevotella sp.]